MVTRWRDSVSHGPLPAARVVAWCWSEELPDVFAALVSAGAMRLDVLGLMPPNLAEGGPRAGDERFVTYTARRPVFEQVLGEAAEGEPGVEVRRGAAVKELTHAGRRRDAARDRRAP